ncbi:GntR family transcriptional regulator [Brachybacterium sp. GCM10030267]|uniref:GntR family transcriptional regulator n=1 Tax=Brachybacterium sp. GCM10030267 TaxID=3273381 RepID=UPI0036147E70
MRIAGDLREAIITGALAPGERLREVALAQQFGISRVPVREALRELATDGYVQLRPNAGARVAEPEHEDMRVLFDMRIVLETSTTRTAAERAARLTSPQGDPEWAAAWEAAHEILRAGDDAISADRPEELAALNVRFHNALGALSGRASFTSLLRQLTGRTQWMHALAPAHVRHRGDAAWNEHREILEHIGRGNAREASELMSRHLERSRNAFLASRTPEQA